MRKSRPRSPKLKTMMTVNDISPREQEGSFVDITSNL
jgi:hypothetical protein